MNYKVFDKDIYTETDEIITINLKTSETNHEAKMYFYDGKELKECCKKNHIDPNMKIIIKATPQFNIVLVSAFDIDEKIPPPPKDHLLDLVISA